VEGRRKERRQRGKRRSDRAVAAAAIGGHRRQSRKRQRVRGALSRSAAWTSFAALAAPGQREGRYASEGRHRSRSQGRRREKEAKTSERVTERPSTAAAAAAFSLDVALRRPAAVAPPLAFSASIRIGERQGDRDYPSARKRWKIGVGERAVGRGRGRVPTACFSSLFACFFALIKEKKQVASPLRVPRLHRPHGAAAPSSNTRASARFDWTYRHCCWDSRGRRKAKKRRGGLRFRRERRVL